MPNGIENKTTKNTQQNKAKQASGTSVTQKSVTKKPLTPAQKAALIKRKKAAIKKKKQLLKAEKKIKKKSSFKKLFFTWMIFILTFGSIFFAYYLENFTQSGLPTPFSLLDIEKEKNPTNETIIAETSKADEEYFNDILFVGDSLTVGLRAYGYIPSAQVYALTGINVSDALTKKFITFSGSSKQYSISQAVAKTKPEKIIFLMGINGLAWYDENVLLEQYEELVRQIISSSPNSFLALQSLYPVTQSYTNSEPRITNKKIDEFNKKIIKIAKDLNIYYLDTASVLKDSKGNLKQEFSSDGLHINKKGYDEVLEYILKHQF